MKGTGLATWPYTFLITNSTTRKTGSALPKKPSVSLYLVPGVLHASNVYRYEDSLHQAEYPDGSENPVNIIVIT